MAMMCNCIGGPNCCYRRRLKLGLWHPFDEYEHLSEYWEKPLYRGSWEVTDAQRKSERQTAEHSESE